MQSSNIPMWERFSHEGVIYHVVLFKHMPSRLVRGNAVALVGFTSVLVLEGQSSFVAYRARC